MRNRMHVGARPDLTTRQSSCRRFRHGDLREGFLDRFPAWSREGAGGIARDGTARHIGETHQRQLTGLGGPGWFGHDAHRALARSRAREWTKRTTKHGEVGSKGGKGRRGRSVALDRRGQRAAGCRAGPLRADDGGRRRSRGRFIGGSSRSPGSGPVAGGARRHRCEVAQGDARSAARSGRMRRPGRVEARSGAVICAALTN